MQQITDSIIMVRPARFGFNPETAENNSFQKIDKGLTSKKIIDIAIFEFDNFVRLLEDHGIIVQVIEDTPNPRKPDAIFPNNWFTTHADGTIITYPMFSAMRRSERREDIVDELSASITNPRRYSFEYFEDEDKFLEGTGSMILDRPHKIIYACLSPRTHVEILEKFSVLKAYKKIFFTARGTDGAEVYHTNVMLTVGEHFALICLESVVDPEERKEIVSSLRETEKELIEISFKQMESFAGNMIQLKNKRGERFIVMSLQAKNSLSEEQIYKLEQHGKIISPDITTIETSGGGSARCMIAENFLHVEQK